MNIFLPIETTARELDYKLALAVLLSEQGHTCVIAHHDLVDKLSQSYEPGIYIGKTIFKTHFPTDTSIYYKYKNLGWKIFYLDEEGGVFPGIEEDWKQLLDRRLDATVLEKDDVILTWGDFQNQHYQASAKCTTKTVGCPRLAFNNDVYKGIISCRNIGEDIFPDEYVLFNMNFGLVNNIKGRGFIFDSKVKYRDSDEDDMKFKVGFWLEQNLIFTKYLEAIKYVANKNPHLNVVVRPHPVENQELYKSLFRNLRNVKVLRCGSAIDWIMSAKCVVHDGCTTGIEAYLLGKKVLTFKPSKENMHDIRIPSMVGQKVYDKETLSHAINFSVVSADSNKESLDYVSSIIDNFKVDHDSLNLIVKEVSNVNDMNTVNKKKVVRFSNIKLQLTLLKHTFRKSVFYYVRMLFPNKVKAYKADRQKYSGFDYSDITKRLTNLMYRL